MCVNLKKSNEKWIWLAVKRYSQKIRGPFMGSRDNSSFENLSKDIEHIDSKTYATHARDFYKLINRKSHIVGKLYTYTVEGTNLVLRHYLAHFVRETYCLSTLFLSLFILFIYFTSNIFYLLSFFCTAILQTC